MLELTGPIAHVEPAPHGLLWAALAIPLIGALLCAVLGDRIKRSATWIAAGIAVATSAAIVAATVALWSVPQPGASLYTFAYPLLRIGTLDVPLALSLDRLGVVLACTVSLGGGAALVGGALSMGTQAPGLVRLVSAGSAAIGGLLLISLADNAVLFFAGWQVAGFAGASLVGLARGDYPRATDAVRVFLIGRLGDAALLAAIALLFWGMGGAWLDDDRFSSDYRARFIAVETEAGQPTGSMVAIPGGDLPRELLTGKGRLTQITYPGAQVFLGIATADQLGPSPTPFGVPPFYEQPLPPGLHKIAIFPGRGATVGGDGNEAALIDVVDIAAGGAYRVVPIGSTVSFREITDQLTLTDAEGSPALWIALRNKRFPTHSSDGGLRLPTAVALLLALAAIARASQVPFGGLMARAARAPAGAWGMVAGLCVVIPSAALLGRFHYLFDAGEAASALLGSLGAAGAVIAALRAAAAPRDTGAWLAASHAGLVAVAVAVGAIGAAVGLAVHAALWTIAIGVASAAKAPRFEAAALFWSAGVIPFGGFWARHDLIRTSIVVDGVSVLPVVWFAAALLATVIVGFAVGHRVGPALTTEPAKRKKTKREREIGSALGTRAAAVAFGLALVGSVVACLPGFVWGGRAMALDAWMHIAGPSSPAPPGGLWVAALSLVAVVGAASAGRRRAAASPDAALLPPAVSSALGRLDAADHRVVRGVFATRRVAREIEEGVIDLPSRLLSSGIAAGWARMFDASATKARVWLVVALGAAAVALSAAWWLPS
jgi:NADH-quinone oxidoreductase subunit L